MRIDVDSREVTAAVAKYLNRPGNDPAEAIAAARTHGLLPLWNDMGGSLLLRPDGEVLTFGWDTPGKLEPVSNSVQDRQIVHAARGSASAKFPSIRGLAPARDQDAVVCPSCNGQGRTPGMPSNIVCACGGLGWLPHDLVQAT